MLDKDWVHLGRADPAYERGATKFVRAVAAALGDVDMIVCPCIDCRNIDRHSGSVVVDHLVTRGMDEAYKMRCDWYHHGELNSVAESESKLSQWNDEVFELYQAAEYLDEEFAEKLDLAEIAEGDDKKEDDDFPAYGNLAGCKVKGKMGCPLCGKNTDSMWLKFSRKHVFMRHRKGLPPTHRFRGKKSWFDGKAEHGRKKRILSGQEIYQNLKNFKNSFGNLKQHASKRKRVEYSRPGSDSDDLSSESEEYEEEEELPVRHNLDVMHVERNVAASIVSTLLHCGKSKDGLNARKDLEELGIRKDLHPKIKVKRTYLPAALWSLSKTEKKIFCKRLFDFKGPDGYCSDISRGVSLDDCKVTGLKSHDYHVLMQQLLPIALRGLLPKGPRVAIVRLCTFFNHLCQRVIDMEQLLAMEAEIDFVRNTARPEGCIAECYLAEECIQFCSEFLKKTTNVQESVDRNTEYENNTILEGRPISRGISFNLTEMEKKIAHMAVIQNMAVVEPYVDTYSIYKTPMEDADVMHHCYGIHLDSNRHGETLKWLAYGPRSCARSYSGYIVNGQRFHTISVDKKTQNNGVYYEATAVCRSSAKDTSQVVDLVSYYGCITDIILLDYNVFYVPLFRCNWAVKGNGVKEEDGFTLVNLNHSQVSFLRDPYHLASQAKQVFYLREDDSSSWYVAMRGPSRRFSQKEYEDAVADIAGNEDT
ncbi:unnamed protein product [Arabidopsis arenosa]|uniref:Transposase-associated domain-containing protein n=1 Tax=Arabidopsis arenosa TaxID=38785 RepID=A0A8S2AGP5_ARAAE|nr:unnamed protein product [Arabidopsis arenosa]